MRRGEREEMGFTYTDSTKVVLEAFGKFKVTLLEAVEPGDLLSWYNLNNSKTVQFADQSDEQRANCIAVEKGDAGAEITACLKAVLGTISTIATGGVVTPVYFASSASFFGAPLYLGEDGKPSSSEGSDYSQIVGRLLARDRILLDMAPAADKYWKLERLTSVLREILNGNDLAWTDLDIDSYATVPVGAIGIILETYVIDTGAARPTLSLRKKGEDVNTWQEIRNSAQVAGIAHETMAVVEMDSDHIIQYRLQSTAGGGTASFYLKLLGWVIQP